MWPNRASEYRRIVSELDAAQTSQEFKGLSSALAIETLATQFIASLRREDYYRRVQEKPIKAQRADPNSPSFDAERAVAYHMQRGDIDEAGWVIFLMTHFARRADTGWKRMRDVYGCLGAGVWDWASVSTDSSDFNKWLEANWQQVGGSFGNHRKYESLRPTANRPMQKVVADYLAWIGQEGHKAFLSKSILAAGNDPHIIFDRLYNSMNVISFGRLAKFDYLSLVGRYRLAPIEAGKAYLDGATGPMRGARLLIDGNPDSTTRSAVLQRGIDQLDARLGMGMAIMEDALCNWQKSPLSFVHYKG